ncbi:MAG: hypothetical protein WCN87_00470 [Chlamydiota bacterium]
MNPTSIEISSQNNLSCLYQSLYHIRRIGSCFGRSEQIASGAANFGTFIGGMLLSCACGKNETVRMTARIVLITTKALSAVKAQIAFAKHSADLIKAFHLQAQKAPLAHVHLGGWSFLSVAQKRRMEHSLNRVIEIIQAVFASFMALIYQLFMTSSYLLELADAIQGKEDAIDQGVKDICINCSTCTQHSSEIFTDLCHYEIKIHQTLRFLGAGYEADLVASRLKGCTLGGMVCQPFVTICGGVKKILGSQWESSPVLTKEVAVII